MGYFNRKHFFSVNLQAMCDAKRRFRWGSIKCAGSAHDATAWATSGIGDVLQKLEELGFWIAGDDAYPLSEYVITPFPGQGIPKYEDNFNFYQSRLRINIECAFGMLVRRWGVLWRNLEVELCKVKSVVFACLILHNVCINHMPK